MTKEEVQKLRVGDIVLFQYDVLEEPIKAQVVAEAFDDDDRNYPASIPVRISNQSAGRLELMWSPHGSKVFRVVPTGLSQEYEQKNVSFNGVKYSDFILIIAERLYERMKRMEAKNK